jgi:hypothetical protein
MKDEASAAGAASPQRNVKDITPDKAEREEDTAAPNARRVRRKLTDSEEGMEPQLCAAILELMHATTLLQNEL